MILPKQPDEIHDDEEVIETFVVGETSANDSIEVTRLTHEHILILDVLSRWRSNDYLRTDDLGLQARERK